MVFHALSMGCWSGPLLPRLLKVGSMIKNSQSKKVRMASWSCFCCSRTSQLSPREPYLKARWWQKEHETMVLVATLLPADPVIVWTVKLSVTCFGVELETWKWELYSYPTHYTLGFNGIGWSVVFSHFAFLLYLCTCKRQPISDSKLVMPEPHKYFYLELFLPHSFPGKCMNIGLMSNKHPFLLAHVVPGNVIESLDSFPWQQATLLPRTLLAFLFEKICSIFEIQSYLD